MQFNESQCPVWIREKGVLKIKTIEKVSIPEARRGFNIKVYHPRSRHWLKLRHYNPKNRRLLTCLHKLTRCPSQFVFQFKAMLNLTTLRQNTGTM